jgi:hypothetical protein
MTSFAVQLAQRHFGIGGFGDAQGGREVGGLGKT